MPTVDLFFANNLTSWGSTSFLQIRWFSETRVLRQWFWGFKPLVNNQTVIIQGVIKCILRVSPNSQYSGCHRTALDMTLLHIGKWGPLTWFVLITDENELCWVVKSCCPKSAPFPSCGGTSDIVGAMFWSTAKYFATQDRCSAKLQLGQIFCHPKT